MTQLVKRADLRPAEALTCADLDHPDETKGD